MQYVTSFVSFLFVGFFQMFVESFNDGSDYMNTTQKINIGLSQFTEFTLKGVSAKTNMVRKIKYQKEYHPAFDYWKQLRDQIVSYHKNDLNKNCFENLIPRIDIKKQPNYVYAIKQYLKFLNKKETIWFDPGKSVWIGDKLSVRSSSELGLLINGVPHLIKLYFKGKNDKVDKRNINSSLILLNTSSYDKTFNFEVNHSVLNLHKNKLYIKNDYNEDMLIALESEASQFVYIWNKI